MSARPPHPVARPIAAELAPRLLRWFRETRRPLPWRLDRDPYRVWVAEVLLQQTRVAQAIPYFERFTARFPDLARLASARLPDVLKIWEGAGYYARARHLHAAAREVVRRWGGHLPGTVEELEQLPGVGPYTARAIASLAFGTPVVALEANGLRVAARWTLERKDPRAAAVRRRLSDSLAKAMASESPAEFNEAIMELGETICRPARPRCGECPVAPHCAARSELPDPAIIPRHSPRAPRPHVRGAVVALTSGGRWLVQRRPMSGLLGGLWEFPGGKIEYGERLIEAARRELREETGLEAPALQGLGVVTHAYSHFSVELHLFRGQLAARSAAGPRARWVTEEGFERLPIPKATEKIARRLGLTRSRSSGPAARPAGSTRVG